MFCFCYLYLCAYFSLQILHFLLVGAQKIFYLGRRGPDNGYAANYGASRKLQKYNVIDAVAELAQNLFEHHNVLSFR